jgi:dipeptidyl aminopeptidase/acylaminoacyl peptidase
MQWNHPDMPWQGGEVYIGDVEIVGDGLSASLEVKNVKKVAGKKGRVSACYPLFASNDILLFTNDESGWIAPWKYDVATGEAGPVLSNAIKEDFGGPMWALGERFPYAIVRGGKGAVWIATRDGRDVVYYLDIAAGEAKEALTPFVQINFPCVIRREDGEQEVVVFAAAGVDVKKKIVWAFLSHLLSGSSPTFHTDFGPLAAAAGATTTTTLSSDSSKPPVLSRQLVSVPKPITLELPGGEGPLHVVFYAPHNPRYDGSSVDGEKPPCVVNVHGGPTGYEPQGLNWSKQYFTSRGWAW